jgi:hypothetical protein
LPGKICKLHLQIFLTGKYKTTEKIKDFFGCGKEQRASRDKRWSSQSEHGFKKQGRSIRKDSRSGPGTLARENLLISFADFRLQILQGKICKEKRGLTRAPH